MVEVSTKDLTVEDDEVRERLARQQSRQAQRRSGSAGRDAENRERGPKDTKRATNTDQAKRTKRRSNQAQKWMRWTHVYISMVAFVVIGFFGITGLLLNHPSWLGGDDIVTTLVEGTMPETVRNAEGDVEFLAVSEFLRSQHNIGGEVTNFDQVGNEGSINYTGPAYGASARFDVVSLDYSVRITEEQFANAMRDLHTGSDTNSAWNWVIDISAGLLVVVALSGLGIQLFMRKRRTKALLWLAAGGLATVVLGWLTLA